MERRFEEREMGEEFTYYVLTWIIYVMSDQW